MSEVVKDDRRQDVVGLRVLIAVVKYSSLLALISFEGNLKLLSIF